MSHRTIHVSVLVLAALLVASCGSSDDDMAGGFDRDRTEQEARELLGLPEDEVPVDDETRIVRRGDEDLAATMDHRPGRRNVELDDDGTGVYVVTRVIVEVPDDEEPLVVE